MFTQILVENVLANGLCVIQKGGIFLVNVSELLQLINAHLILNQISQTYKNE